MRRTVVLLLLVAGCGEVVRRDQTIDAADDGDGGNSTGPDAAPGARADAAPGAPDARDTTLAAIVYGPDYMIRGTGYTLNGELLNGQAGDLVAWTFQATDGTVTTPSGSQLLGDSGGAQLPLSYVAPGVGNEVTLTFTAIQFPGATPFVVSRQVTLCNAPCNIAAL